MDCVCNITGKTFHIAADECRHRELLLKHGYNSRFRAVCYELTHKLYGTPHILANVSANKTIRGIGMSDARWADLCADKFDYTNTQYHCEPRLNIYNSAHIQNYKGVDFVISSDVFEHIDPYPGIQLAFDNLYALLKPGGFIVFTVPYSTTQPHREHFPNLFDYRIVQEHGERVLHNVTKEGIQERHVNLVFHGGEGHTLEMRIFSRASITTHLELAGFINITFHDNGENYQKHGIWMGDELVVTADKP
jgi:SAM-dependent methyltransferase